MVLNLEDYTCEFCGKPCKNIVYAAFVCDDPECLEKARVARGGPGGHMARKAAGRPIIPEDLEEAAKEFSEGGHRYRDNRASRCGCAHRKGTERGDEEMDEKVCELLNDQINKEMYSAYLYLDFSNYYSRLGLDGFASWYRVQAEEEMEHAMKFYDYMQDNDIPVTLGAIAKPDKSFDSPDQPLKAGLEHEIYVTGLINDIYAAAAEARDYRTCFFLEWFINEQAEEEKNARDLITMMNLFGSDGKNLYHLDRELQKRQAD